MILCPISQLIRKSAANCFFLDSYRRSTLEAEAIRSAVLRLSLDHSSSERENASFLGPTKTKHDKINRIVGFFDSENKDVFQNMICFFKEYDVDGSGSNITLVGLLVDGLVMEEEGGREGRPALIKLF